MQSDGFQVGTWQPPATGLSEGIPTEDALHSKTPALVLEKPGTRRYEPLSGASEVSENRPPSPLRVRHGVPPGALRSSRQA